MAISTHDTATQTEPALFYEVSTSCGEAKSKDPSGEVNFQNQLPSAETLQQVARHRVLDRLGKAHRFKDLYDGPDTADRVLVIFVRHFFCGSCQEYLRSLLQVINPDFLSRLPVSTSIAVIGCGDPGLIDIYASKSGCDFPIYADPTRKLYTDLGMTTSLALGPRPEYMRKGMVRIVMESIWQCLKQIPSGLAGKGGDSRQIGGEFLFEASHDTEGKTVTWCHRMKTTRDHTEIPALAQVLNPQSKH
ncbi:hypothetical protein ARAM_004106 [Aspergillus rambellii]|uniref:AhpC/TSA antioxidant enzyme-domain-containing protein n=2 Tax=Aspergillus subgen. Nidulantes TaxID=2720870 RepID=A0A0F8UKZ6_9EURO|nr:hypothetical protein ARAM_004106 [Aspergillus rambellii]